MVLFKVIDTDGFFVEPRSDCCHAPIVYFRQDTGIYVKWDGWWEVDADALRCDRCASHCQPTANTDGGGDDE